MTTVPPPAAGPRPPEPSDDEPGTDPAMYLPVSKKDMRSAFRFNEMFTVVTAVVAAGAALIVGYTVFIARAEAAGRAASVEVAKKQLELETAQTEVRQDVRELYWVMLTGKRSERLEQPLPQKDGGR